MALDPASRDRIAALAGSSSATVRAASPDAASSPPPEEPDPEFWGTEPRRVRRTRRTEAAPPEERATWSPRLAAVVDRLREGRLEVGAGVVAIVLVALVAGVVWYRMGAGGDRPPSARDARPGATSAPVDDDTFAVPAGATPVTVTTPPAAAGRRGKTIVVHVAGAVVRPGVLLMPAGARVIDAVEGAGGATPDADLDRVNLAAELADGQRILITRVGEVPAVEPVSGTGSTDPAAPIDLNTATREQLEALPGIGPALADAIIRERERRGGFRSVNELREVRGIGEARFAELRERVAV